MRLSCPGCGAVYEAPIASVGPTGRLVECGACGRRWRALPPVGTAGPAMSDLARPTAAMTAAARDPAAAEPGAPPTLRDPASEPAAAQPVEPAPSRSGGAFMAGFALVSSAALIAVVVYARHDGLAAAAPALEEPLAIYADWVDARREELRETFDAMRGRIGG